MFDLTFTLTFDDYKSFLKILRKRQRAQNAKRNMIALAFLIVFFGGLFLLAGASLSALLRPENIAPLIIIGAFFAFFLKFGVPKLWRRNFEKQMIGAHPISVKADKDILSVTQNGLETKINWKRPTELTMGEEHLFLWLSPVQSMIVPRRVFADTAEIDAFSDFVRARMNDAQQ